MNSAKSIQNGLFQQFNNSLIISCNPFEVEKEIKEAIPEVKEETFTRKRYRSKSPKSRSRSRNRSRDRDASRSHSKNSYHNYKRTRDYSPEIKSSRHDTYKPKHSRLGDRDHKRDPLSNLSYEEKGIMKISVDMIVPDYLVSLMIGKNGNCIKTIMGKSGALINFQKEVFKT